MSLLPNQKPSQSLSPVKVWDLPVRLFHWGLVALVTTLFISASLGAMELHALAGESVLALVLFRLIWGLCGSQTARFSNFLSGPGTIRAYLRSHVSATPGHNPLGGWMVLGLLLVLSAQATSGLFANDDVLFDGPLSHLIGKGLSDTVTGLHEALFDLLLIMVGLHVAAVLFHLLVLKDNLIRPMLTGWKMWPAGGKPLNFVNPVLALVIVLGTGAVVAAVVLMA